MSLALREVGTPSALSVYRAEGKGMPWRPRRRRVGAPASGLFIMLLMVSLLLSGASIAWADQGDHEGKAGTAAPCPLDFEATVHYGPSTGFSLIGTLHLHREGDRGKVDGVLAHEAGFSVPVHGQILGRAANLLFDFGDDVFVYGTGTVLRSRSEDECSNFTGGGNLTGPDRADVGSWAVSGVGGGLITLCTTPVIINPNAQSFSDGQRVYMTAAQSCISTSNAGLIIVDPLTATQSGPFTLHLQIGYPSSFFSTGSFSSIAFPLHTCQTLIVKNFNFGTSSKPVLLCQP